MKILTIVGARPQFIKAAVLSRIIAKEDDVDEILVHTGQHYDANMSEVFFEEMEIPKPKYNLQIQSKLHGEMTGLMMVEIEKVCLIEKPDWILVYGDTNSTLAGALVAAKLKLKLAHIEAGLRSFNKDMPEEINRIITDRVSTILFCPTDNAQENLKKEGFLNFKEKEICRTGDVMFDAAIFYSKNKPQFPFPLPSEFVLNTIHRAENTDDPEKLMLIMESLKRISQDIPILFPLHPRTASKLSSIVPNFKEEFSEIMFVEPLSYLEMIVALKNCKYVITDSGGLQKEAYFFKKMCLTLRNETEWVELTENGYNVLSDINVEEILTKAQKIKNMEKKFDKDLYGDGNAGKLILEKIKAYQR